MESVETSKFGVKVRGHFVQLVSLRFRGEHPVHVAVLQPEDNAGWQTLGFLEAGELSDVAVPSEVVELAAGAIAKARKGQISMKSRDAVQSVAEKFQRGPDLYTKVFTQFERLAESYRGHEGTPRPILFCDLSCGVSDGAIATLDRAVLGATRRRSAGGSGQVSEDAFSAFFTDPKESHRIIGKTRVDTHMKGLYTEGKYKAEGFEPVPKPADVKSMEDECGKPLPVTLTLLGSVEREGKYYLTFPETTTLKVSLKGENAKRYEELKKDFPHPPAPNTPTPTHTIQDFQGHHRSDIARTMLFPRILSFPKV